MHCEQTLLIYSDSFLTNEFLKAFLVAIISAIGAFIPVLGVMYLHYRIRKNFYNQLRDGFQKELESLEERVSQYEGYLSVHQKIHGFKDSQDLGFNPEIRKKLGQEEFERFFQYYTNLEKWRDSFRDEKLKKEIDINYIKNFNFKRYLIGLLNDRFPDRYFKE